MAQPMHGPLLSGGLMTRAVVGLALAAVALAAIKVGGAAFAVLVALGVGLMFWEWCGMQRVGRTIRAAGILLLAGAVLATLLGRPHAGLAAVAVVALGGWLHAWSAGGPSSRGRNWFAAGLLYAGLPAVALVWLRDRPDGFALVLWTMAIVWATDIFAYFAGRAIGGPKLLPAVSPKKTWAGLLGGVAAAGLVSAGLGAAFGWTVPALLLLVAGIGLGVVAQAGDLFESWLKRRAGVKDSGTLLPGHGGIMDRVDGLVPVACLVALGVAFS